MLETNQRFTSVWDALPPDLHDADELHERQTEAETFAAASKLAAKKGFALVRSTHGCTLTAPGRVLHIGDTNTVLKYLGKLPKRAAAAFSSAGCTVTLLCLKTRYRRFLGLVQLILTIGRTQAKNSRLRVAFWAARCPFEKDDWTTCARPARGRYTAV